MGNDVKNKQVNIYIDQTAAGTALDKLQSKADVLNKRIADLQASGKSATKELAQLDKINPIIQGLTDRVAKGWAPTIKEQTNLVRQLNNELANISKSDPAFAAKEAQFKKSTQLLNELKGSTQSQADANEKLGGSFGRIFTRVTEYFAAYNIVDTISSSIKNFFTSSIEEANKAEDTYSRLQTILTNLGRIDAFDRLKKKAEDLSTEFKTFKADEMVDVFQKLIVYGKLTENQIDELSPVIINLAAQQRITLADATEIVTKSLEGNNKGLKDLGINLKNASTTSERFGVIMDELKPRVEGAAKAFGETTAGEIKATETQINELKEQIGTQLQPLLKNTYVGIQGLIQGVEDFFTKLGESFQQLGKDIVYTSKVLGDFITFQFKAGKLLQDQRANEKQAAADRLLHTQQVANADEFAAKFAHTAAQEKIEDQKKILAQQESLRQNSLQVFNDLKAQNKLGSDEGKKAYIDLLTDTKVVQQLKQSIASQTDKTTLGLGSAGDLPDKSKYDELLKAAEEFNKKIRDLQQGSVDASLTQDQKEIADVKHKYDEIFIAYNELLKKLKGSKISLGFSEDDIKNLENNELTGLIKKQQSAQQLKTDEAEYKNQLALSENYFAQKKQQAQEDFVNGITDKKTFEANVTQIDAESKAQQFQIAKDYSASVKQAAIDVTNFQIDQLNAQTKAAIKAYEEQEALRKSLEADAARTALQTAQTQVDIARKGSQQQYDAQKNLINQNFDNTITALKQQHAEKIKAANGDNDAIKQIDANFSQDIINASDEADHQTEDAKKQHLGSLVDLYAGYASQVVGIFDQLAQAQNNKENAQLQAEANRNNIAKQKYQSLLNGKLITQQEYNIRAAKLDADLDKKKQEVEKKQFERNKKIQIAQTLINAAAGAIKLWIDPGFPEAIPLEFLLAGQTLAEIAVIASQKPTFAKGGLLYGPSHSNGGMPIINPLTGEKVAEVEGGEPILSKATYRNNKPAIDALLHSSMYQGGATVDPVYFHREYRPVAAGDIVKTYQTMKFASGGILPSANASAPAPPADPHLVETLQQSQMVNVQLMQTVLDLKEQLKKPIKGDWNLKQLDDATDQRARIRADATFNG